jgi:hypothetical protein
MHLDFRLQRLFDLAEACEVARKDWHDTCKSYTKYGKGMQLHLEGSGRRNL